MGAGEGRRRPSYFSYPSKFHIQSVDEAVEADALDMKTAPDGTAIGSAKSLEYMTGCDVVGLMKAIDDMATPVGVAVWIFPSFAAVAEMVVRFAVASMCVTNSVFPAVTV